MTVHCGLPINVRSRYELVAAQGARLHSPELVSTTFRHVLTRETVRLGTTLPKPKSEEGATVCLWKVKTMLHAYKSTSGRRSVAKIDQNEHGWPQIDERGKSCHPCLLWRRPVGPCYRRQPCTMLSACKMVFGARVRVIASRGSGQLGPQKTEPKPKMVGSHCVQ